MPLGDRAQHSVVHTTCIVHACNCSSSLFVINSDRIAASTQRTQDLYPPWDISKTPPLGAFETSKGILSKMTFQILFQFVNSHHRTKRPTIRSLQFKYSPISVTTQNRGMRTSKVLRFSISNAHTFQWSQKPKKTKNFMGQSVAALYSSWAQIK